MKRNATVLTICSLLLVADLLIINETLMKSDGVPADYAAALVIELVAATMLAWLGIAAYRKRFRRQKRPANRWRSAIAQPLRRIFASVWF